MGPLQLQYRRENLPLRKVPWIPCGPQHQGSLAGAAAVAEETMGNPVVRRQMGHLVVSKALQRPFSRQQPPTTVAMEVVMAMIPIAAKKGRRLRYRLIR